MNHITIQMDFAMVEIIQIWDVKVFYENCYDILHNNSMENQNIII